MKKLIPLTVLIIGIFSASTFAQFEIGASYELRDIDPQNGFGLRVEKGILEKLPLINLSLRLHGSYFSEENNVDENNFSYSEDLTNYDVGVAAIGGLSVGLLEPYVGLGLGTENYEKVVENYQGDPTQRPEPGDDNNLYWNMLVGAKVTIIPLIKPFVEYRYSNKSLDEPTLEGIQTHNGRVMFGVVLSF
ncbi:MAG: porin family protein [Balneolaceae bacterium]